MYPASSISDLSAVDSVLTALELQLHKIKIRMREETEAIPKAKVFLFLGVSLEHTIELKHLL